MKHLEITARRSMTLVLVAVAGCTAPPVTDLDGGRHHLAVRAEHGQEGLDLDRANAAQLADKYCHKSGQRAKIEGYDQEVMPDPRRLSIADPRRREQLLMGADAMQDHCTPTYSINEQGVSSKMTQSDLYIHVEDDVQLLTDLPEYGRYAAR